jgi:two-component system nitrogen regulation sensor histidine kinase GlnL
MSASRDTPPDPRLILEALPVAVAVFGAGERFLHANPAAEQFFGLSLPQLRHLSLFDLLPADNPLFALLGRVRREGVEATDHDLTLESPRLSRRGVSVHAAPLGEEGEAVTAVFQDLSQARALGQQLSVLGAARSVTGMAAVLAHEVKNPLSGIRGAAQLLEASTSGSDRGLALLIREEADRIRALIERMEGFGEGPLERGPVNVHRVLEHVRKLAEAGFAAGIRFHELYDPSLPPVWGHRDQLVQALLNLVKNAAEAIREGGGTHGEITLATSFQPGVRLKVPGAAVATPLPLLITVRDNGRGIPEDIRPHLFEPFVTTRPHGSGLGLALVAKIIGDHGGLIEVESRPGRTEFRLYLPMYRPPAGGPGRGGERR